jgi:hypothetical protein
VLHARFFPRVPVSSFPKDSAEKRFVVSYAGTFFYAKGTGGVLNVR